MTNKCCECVDGMVESRNKGLNPYPWKCPCPCHKKEKKEASVDEDELDLVEITNLMGLTQTEAIVCIKKLIKEVERLRDFKEICLRANDKVETENAKLREEVERLEQILNINRIPHKPYSHEDYGFRGRG